MRFCLKRCKHCGTEYSYQASGNGCFDELNDPNFCPECKKAIIEALSKIPKKFVDKWNDFEITSELKEIFRKIRDDEIEKRNKEMFPVIRKVMMFSEEIKVAAEFSYDFVKYIVESETDDIFDEKAKWQRLEEYNLLENKFTGNLWKSGNSRSYNELGITHFYKSEFIPEKAMSAPSGKLWFDLPPK